ncbi:MAG TPA: tripartite tricarboxylate transporter substrate binding protein [Mycobacteriales bacterium]|jgi:putative tricarboxylic transport membrane protein|nr:tripartite tricarboxylate transporter substrate binding protein [Mycobacteriales bacterium]
MSSGLSRRSLLLGALLAPLAAGCAGTVVKPGDLSRLRVMAPASPGGGWDTTSRVLQRVIQREGLARNVQVFNVEGAGGIIGLGQLAREDDDALVMTMGLVMLGAVLTNKSAVTLTDVTPVARLTGEAEIVVVPASSPYRTMQDFVTDWSRNPRAVPVAGGSAGGSDQILAGLVAQATGVDPRQINYIPYSGGGESLAALLGGQVSAGISGIGEYSEQVRSGDLRALAVSGPEPSGQLPEVPTLRDQGIEVELTNWRGLMARPGMAEEARSDLIALVASVRESDEWQEALDNRGWDDEFLPGEDFGAFLADEQTRVRDILVGIGLVR